ncbi:MAG: tripartite tricarboxylate transporter permease, partial [Alphaproteobacteria bacterium]
FAKLVEIPKGILLPLIVVLSVVGTYAIQNSVIDVYWMVGCGILGYFLRVYGYQTGPVVLGVILGPLMDASFRRAMISVQDDPLALLRDMASNPLSLALVLSLVLMLASQSPLRALLRRAR